MSLAKLFSGTAANLAFEEKTGGAADELNVQKVYGVLCVSCAFACANVTGMWMIVSHRYVDDYESSVCGWHSMLT